MWLTKDKTTHDQFARTAINRIHRHTSTSSSHNLFLSFLLLITHTHTSTLTHMLTPTCTHLHTQAHSHSQTTFLLLSILLKVCWSFVFTHSVFHSLVFIAYIIMLTLPIFNLLKFYLICYYVFYLTKILLSLNSPLSLFLAFLPSMKILSSHKLFP